MYNMPIYVCEFFYGEEIHIHLQVQRLCTKTLTGAKTHLLDKSDCFWEGDKGVSGMGWVDLFFIIFSFVLKFSPYACNIFFNLKTKLSIKMKRSPKHIQQLRKTPQANLV